MKRVTLVRAQKEQANRQKIDLRSGFIAYEIHKQIIIVKNEEKPSAFKWDTKSLKWIKTEPTPELLNNKFIKFATEQRAVIPDNAPNEFKATSTIEINNSYSAIKSIQKEVNF